MIIHLNDALVALFDLATAQVDSLTLNAVSIAVTIYYGRKNTTGES